MLLDINDAVKVAIDNIRNNYNCDVDEEDEEILHQEMEQKVWITDFTDEPFMLQLMGLIMDVNPAEICAQIESDNLKNWCEKIQVSMQMCLIKMKK